MPAAPAIALATLNAKYFHASLGLRYLLANLGELRDQAQIREFTIQQKPADIAERLLQGAPRIVGLGVYVWNVRETAAVVAILKAVAPELRVVLGGPEVSFPHDWPQVCALADHVVTGQADRAFAELCRAILAGEAQPKLVVGGELDPRGLALPYDLYDDADLAHRLTYVEASRGCPFKCEFCLSALDTTARPVDLDAFFAHMQGLLDRGARQFKFVDRTFNLAPATAVRILRFFLDRLRPDLHLHFELVPDRLPPEVAALLAEFAPATVQLEIGVQTLDPAVQARISRKQDEAKTLANLRWLRHNTHAHLHVDLIAGLPGEGMAGFGAGFDRLVDLQPQEIQLGILKRLRGAPIARHAQEFGLRFDPEPPYALLASNDLSFVDLQRVGRVARLWDLVGNSGRFPNARAVLLGQAPFARLLVFADWVAENIGQTHAIAQERLFSVVFGGLTQALGVDVAQARDALERDYALVPAKGALRLVAVGRTQAADQASTTHRARQVRAVAATTAAPIEH